MWIHTDSSKVCCADVFHDVQLFVVGAPERCSAPCRCHAGHGRPPCTVAVDF